MVKNLEPGLLLLVDCGDRYRELTVELIEFLMITVKQYDTETEKESKLSVKASFEILLHMKVVKNINNLTINLEIPEQLRAWLISLFDGGEKIDEPFDPDEKHEFDYQAADFDYDLPMRKMENFDDDYVKVEKIEEESNPQPFISNEPLQKSPSYDDGSDKDDDDLPLNRSGSIVIFSGGNSLDGDTLNLFPDSLGRFLDTKELRYFSMFFDELPAKIKNIKDDGKISHRLPLCSFIFI